LALIWGHALIMFIVFVLYLRVPAVAKSPKKDPQEARKRSALRDLPYLAVAQVSGITRLGETVLTVALPLWIVRHTHAPRALAAWVITINTIMIVMLQVRATRGADTTSGTTRIQRWSFFALTSACLIAGVTGGMSTVAAIAVLIVAVV